MNQAEVFAYMVDVLNRLKIPYMIVGSVASIVYGKPRLTYDMDIVVELTQEQIEPLVSSFGKEYYVDSESIRAAVRQRHHFNIIHVESGNKIDFFLCGNSKFEKEQFARRRQEMFDDFRKAYFATPEDIIINKLDYYRQTGIEKHLEDIRGILEISGAFIDFNHIEEWTKEKGTYEAWKKLLPK